MVAVKEVEGGQRDTFVISDVPCMSSALRCSQYFFFYIYVALADMIFILGDIVTPSGVDVLVKRKSFQVQMLLLKYIPSET